MTCDIQEIEKKKKFFGYLTVQSSILILMMLLMIFAFVLFRENVFGLSDHAMRLGFIYTAFMAISHFEFLPVILIGIPIIGAIIQLLYGEKSCFRRDRSVIFMTFLTIVVIFMMYPVAATTGLRFEIAEVLGLGLTFNIDMLGYTVLLFSSIIWFLVMVYAHEYMKKERHCTRFFFFIALTYSAVLGTIMSGDLLTMFLFFEIMTFTSYMLVVHGQKEESYRAGQNYILMGLIGGFLILAAILLIYFHVGDLSFKSAIERLGDLGSIRYWIIGLLVLGFGIKAGMAPVHVWLPRAHPVAPTPASALLSGVMIKVGAFGILRVATSYYFPPKNQVTDYLDPIWKTSENIGAAIIWFGIITMAIGVFYALQQSNMKKMLAYHSVSQMGYIIVGIGIAIYLGYRGAMGYSGAIYHIINHGLFKSLLFMVVGVVYYHTHEYDMYKLGGLWKKLPLTTIVCLIACFGISGIPFFNGFVSKSILHHGLIEAFEYGDPSFKFAEIMYMLVSAGTVCSFIKLFYYVFVQKTNNTYPDLKRSYTSLDSALSTISLLIVLIGIFPHFLLKHFIIPAMNQTTYDPEFIDHYIGHIKFFTGEDLLSMLYILVGGSLIFVLGTKFNWFHLKIPKWLSLEYLFFLPGYLLMRNTCKILYGDRCPIDDVEMNTVTSKDENIGFVERFVVTLNVLNRRYERSIIQADALIYTISMLIIVVFMFIFNVL